MPFARVGAMPQTTRNDGQSAASRSNRPRTKGITMEDLKKQTAIRLAQEQQQGQVLPGPPQSAAVASDPRTKHPVVTPETLAARRLASANSHVNVHAQTVNRDAAPVHYQRLHHQNPVVHHVSTSVDYGQSHFYDQASQGSKNSRNRTPHGHGQQSTAPSPSMGAAPQQPSTAAARSRYHPNQQSGFLSVSPPTLPANPPPSSSPGYNTASSSQGGQSSSTSKLPHGLTVHELKEMTKARLQAEAAEKMPPGASSPPIADIEARDGSGFDTVQPNYGQQNQDYDGISHGSDPHLVSTQVPSNKPPSYDQGSSLGQPAQVSPLPPSFQAYVPPVSSFTEAGSLDQRTVPIGNRNRVDSFPENWESASITSHNSTVASDYLGSDSAFPGGVGGFSQVDEPPGMTLGRTQSYPIGNSRPGGADMSTRAITPTSAPSPLGSSYYESSSSLAQNRQRAMTLSPRPGLSLLHEDRPGFSDEDLGIPNFSSSRHARQQLTARSRRSFSPILQQQGLADPMVGFGSNAPGVIGGSLLDNRPRTSSAVSLPAISHTAEEFALDTGVSGRRSSDSTSIRNAPISEHSTDTIGAADSFLGSSSFYGDGDGTARSSSSSSVFRNEFGGIPPPPGLGGPAQTGSMDSLGSNRVRAATWVAGQVSGSDVFGPSSGFYEYPREDTLAGDLASILKLSGAEEKPDPGRSSMFNDISEFL